MKVEIFEINLNNHSLEYLNVNASYVYADDNKLTKLRIKGKTRSLSLRNNTITELTFDDHLSVLRNLNLDGNNISSDTLYDLTQKITNIETLDISNNLQAGNSLKVDTFSELSRIERLILNNIGLTEMTYGLFAHQKTLKYLDLSGNPLNEIDFHMLSSLSNLEVVDVSGTNISYIRDCRRLKDILPKLRSIGIDNNNWACQWLSRTSTCLNSIQVKIIDPVNPVKNESSVVGIKCTQMKASTVDSNATTTEVVNTTDKNHVLISKIDELHEKIQSHSYISHVTKTELILSTIIAVVATIFVIIAFMKVRNYFRHNGMRMPRFAARGSDTDTIVTYENSLNR
jgi:hypothetical protein